ncbi:hypothetical protein EHS25_005793 [Saitozyma podzolica]|uniref:Uncharacterized protein n=1 Tax=Saitozyma podzolica TaxID=1890683 RepID=A0A427XVE6_9TREE|nr:hypothetical protein EHS25_005793 [Saitozyma podzolica]
MSGISSGVVTSAISASGASGVAASSGSVLTSLGNTFVASATGSGVSGVSGVSASGTYSYSGSAVSAAASGTATGVVSASSGVLTGTGQATGTATSAAGSGAVSASVVSTTTTNPFPYPSVACTGNQTAQVAYNITFPAYTGFYNGDNAWATGPVYFANNQICGQTSEVWVAQWANQRDWTKANPTSFMRSPWLEGGAGTDLAAQGISVSCVEGGTNGDIYFEVPSNVGFVDMTTGNLTMGPIERNYYTTTAVDDYDYFFSIMTYPDGSNPTTAEPAQIVNCAMWGFVSKNDTHPTVNILGQEPWYELNLTLTSDPIDIECITAPVMSTCNSTWNATQIMVEAQNQTKVTVDVPWQNSASYVFGNGSTSLSRTCTNSSSIITLEIFDGPANSWQNTTAVKTVTCNLTGYPLDAPDEVPVIYFQNTMPYWDLVQSHGNIWLNCQ